MKPLHTTHHTTSARDFALSVGLVLQPLKLLSENSDSMNLCPPNIPKLLTFLFTFINPTGIPNRLITFIIIFFPVALLNPATVSVETLAVSVNLPVRRKVPRFAELLSISNILRGVLGIIPSTIPSTPASLPTRLTSPRRWLVALTRIILVLPVIVDPKALKVIEVGLDFTLRPMTLIFVCLV